MALYVFAYDEPVICRECGANDFTLLQATHQLRCNCCLACFIEQELVEEAVETMTDYIRSNGITERLTPSVAYHPQASDYNKTSTLTALITALQILSYPQAAESKDWYRAIGMLKAGIDRERLKQV